MSTNANYHFMDKTASTFNLLVVAHLGLAVLTSIFDSDVSASIAVMGIVSVLSASVPLLLLYLIFAPASIVVDIIRMSIAPMAHHGAFGFFVFLKVVEWLAKGGAVFFGYQVYTSASSGGDNQGAYEEINNGAQGQPTQSFQAPDPFNPTTYTAPQAPPAPIETGVKPSQPM